MKIIELNVQGFRSLKHVEWKPTQLNVLIGPNASGKSNVLRCLELISSSARGSLGKYVQGAGGFEPLVWDGALDAISFTLLCSPVQKDRTASRDSLTYHLELTRLGKSSSYAVTKELLANYSKVRQGTSSRLLKKGSVWRWR
jgi:predicted ATPase